MPEREGPTGAIWERREYAFLSGWVLLALALLLLPALVRRSFPLSAVDDTALNSAWAAAGGIIGALVNVVSIQMNHQRLVERVKRGLNFEPGLGGVVAWFVFLSASLGFVTVNLGPVTTRLPDFAATVVLGGLAGFIWEVILGRIRARAQDLREGA